MEAYHVPFDELTNQNSIEHELEYWATRRGRVALIGDSGAGKSSVMASVLGAFSPSIPASLVPTRIPVELAEPSAITEVGDFGRHLVGHILNWAAPEALGADEQEEVERRLADMERRSGRRRRAGFSLGTGWLLPVDARLSGDLEGAASDFDRQLRNGDVVLALRRLVDLFRARGLEPFLVFDDTDAWLQLPGQEEAAWKLASGFFGSNVRMLTREIDCGFALAIHRSYLSLPAYQGVADSLEAIDLPALQNPAEAIEAILQRRVDVDEMFPISDGSWRFAGLAVRKAHDDDDATLVTQSAVIAARAQRETVRGGP